MVYEYVILSAASDLLRLLYDNTYAIRRSQSSWQMHQVTGRGSIEVPARSWKRSISFVIGGVYDLEGCVNKPVPRPFERGWKKESKNPCYIIHCTRQLWGFTTVMLGWIYRESTMSCFMNSLDTIIISIVHTMRLLFQIISHQQSEDSPLK